VLSRKKPDLNDDELNSREDHDPHRNSRVMGVGVEEGHHLQY
jgi:hypothetical protein